MGQEARAAATSKYHMGNHHRARFTLMISSFIVIMFWLAALQPAEADDGWPMPSRWVDPDLLLPSLPQGGIKVVNLSWWLCQPEAFELRSRNQVGRVLLSWGPFSLTVDTNADSPVGECCFLDPDVIDRGLETVARSCPGLRKLSLVASDSEAGLMAIAGGCDTMQELELHRCSDLALRPIFAFKNLQILRLVGSVDGLYCGPRVTDIGLTILAHGCKRLVKLELSGCEGSYDGISAIGRCCMMLEELTISDHRMGDGWLAALSFCGNLKTLRMQSCRRIDADPGPSEHLGTCPAIETLQMQRCQLRDKRSLQALFMVCEAVRDVVFENCWGLDNNMFALVSICRRVKFLSLEGCSLVTTEGFESVVLSWMDLQRLTVISCNNIKDGEVSPALSSLFPVLKELKWRPDSKSALAGTGMAKKGARFFRRL
ncbi:F-box protein At5g51380-like [Musa acuminata AAA Group]|uniref:F-box protein At5g51380-like n=1 Tax=Musa acuminata AAA Group TaxID=214697 RepID=UPI0031DD19FA